MTIQGAISELQNLFSADDIPLYYKSAIEKVIETIVDELPSADAVEVVRCKDCRWYDNRYGDVCHNPRYGDGYANYQPPYVDEDYWCKDGEHKGGDTE